MKMQTSSNKNLSRRDFLKIAGGAALVVAGAGVMPQFLRKTLLPEKIADAAEAPPDLYFAGTDGWISMPADSPAIGFYFPDDIAPAPFNTYIFGFRNITGLTPGQISLQKEHAQHSAPLFWVDEYDGTNEFRLQLTNLGLQIRPDLTDSHTLHWHGFRNVITFFDGEPTGSVSVPVGRNFTYVFRPRDPGTYMYHCHVEDVEHVHMGMTGLVFVRPKQNTGTLYDSGGFAIPAGKYAYNDYLQPTHPASTAYNREFAMFLSEVWAEAHWCDSHIQLPDWSDYRADFSLLNGRAYPDTTAPNADVDLLDAAQKPAGSNQESTGFHTIPYARDVDGGLVGVSGHDGLQYQPHSSLVTCKEGEKVLLRFANLGFREAAMTLAGIQMKVIGRDATLMRGRDGTDTSYETDTISIGAGESYDVIFTAPSYDAKALNADGYNTYVLYNRRLTQVDNLQAGAEGGFGGQRTEIRVYPTGAAIADQQYPNDLGM